MSKPYRVEDFLQTIIEDRTWRLREISDLKSITTRSDGSQQRALLRALVALCYAHWEGYVRYAASKYMEHIAIRKRPYNRLDPQFLRNLFLPRLAALSRSGSSLQDRCALVDEILSSHTKQYARVNDDLINTRSNLSYSTFSEICLVCGIHPNLLQDRETFIDTLLLKRRNAIAHGENTFIAVTELDQLTSETIEIMRRFGDQLENNAVMQTYAVHDAIL